jgi:hypothetical protein
MSYFNNKRFTMKQVIGLLTVVFLGISVIAYAAMTKPHPDFTNGQTISSSQVNDNFNALYNAMPAVADVYNYNSGNFTSSTIATVPISMTVTPLRDGYIVVRGSGKFTITQSIAANNYINIWLSVSSVAGNSSSPDRIMRLNTSSSPHEITQSIDVSGTFSVTGGVDFTISLSAIRDATGNNITSYGQRSSIEVLFVPSLLKCSHSGSNYYGNCQ